MRPRSCQYKSAVLRNERMDKICSYFGHLQFITQKRKNSGLLRLVYSSKIAEQEVNTKKNYYHSFSTYRLLYSLNEVASNKKLLYFFFLASKMS